MNIKFIVDSLSYRNYSFYFIWVIQFYIKQVVFLPAFIIRKSVLQREAEFSTAVGYEVAIPHGASDDVTESFVAVSTIENPILWGEESVRMIFMIGVPEHKRTKEHLQILAWLSRNLMHDDFRSNIINATTKTQLFECLSRLEQS